MPVQFGRFHIDLRTTCDHGRLSLCVNWMQYAFDYLVGLLHLPGAVQMWVVHNATMRIADAGNVTNWAISFEMRSSGLSITRLRFNR